MKIAIDATRAVIETAGIGRYSFEIIKNLIANDTKNQYLVFSTHFNDSTQKTKTLNSFIGPNVKVKRLKIPGSFKEYFWATRINFLKYFLEDSEVLFAPSFFEVSHGLSIPQIVTIHDMTPSLFPEQRGEELSMRLAIRTKTACQKAKRVICVSNSTRDDLLRIANIEGDKTQVIYPGLKKFGKVASKLPKKLKKDNYILYVGTLEPRKNLIGLLRAYDKLPADLKEKYPLVIVGGKGWNDSGIYAEFNKSGLKKHVIFTGFIRDSQLARLYKDCRVFIYPSLYEGFGLPVVEAQSLGATVITSNISSLPEAGGDGVIYINPNKPGDIANKLEKSLKDDSLRRSLSKKAMENAKKFSWKKSALDTLEQIEKSVVLGAVSRYDRTRGVYYE